jgi:hypothetical protein
MPVAETPLNTPDLLLRTSPGRPPHPLELFVRLEGDDESHFYTQGLTLSEFGSVFGPQIRPLDVLIYRMPSELLNPNYWEPLTREAENVVREKMNGIIARSEGDRALLFRADRVSRGRLLRDGLDVPVELLDGHIFRTTGEGLLKLAQAWSGHDHFEWVGLAGQPKDAIAPDTLATAQQDLSQSRLSLREEVFLYASQEDGLTRVVFSKRAHLNRAVEALIRGFLHGAAGVHVGRMSHAIIDEFVVLAEGLGISADPARDVINTGRTVEVKLWLGRTPWGVSPRPGREAMLAKEKALLYYDSISGLWDVAS